MIVNAKWEGYKEWVSSEDKWSKDVINLTIKEIEDTAYRIERDAKLIVPVDTGELRGSLTTDIRKSSNSITTETGTDVDYSEVIEFGSFSHRAQPYLLPSFDRNITSLEKTIGNILRG